MAITGQENPSRRLDALRERLEKAERQWDREPWIDRYHAAVIHARRALVQELKCQAAAAGQAELELD